MNRVLMTGAAFATVLPIEAAAPPAIGERAPDCKFSTPDGKTIQLSEVEAKGPVVLVVLRGYPGYQCPYCNRQVQDFIQKSQGFCGGRNSRRVGLSRSAQDLGAKANEFLADKKLPENFDLVLDPGYEFTNMYGFRWDAPHETAYPSTFLIETKTFELTIR